MRSFQFSKELVLAFKFHTTGFGFVKHKAFQRFDFMRPWMLVQYSHRIAMSGVPAVLNAAGTEVDIF